MGAFVLTLGGQLVGCGGSGALLGGGAGLVSLWLLSVFIVGLLAGCGSGGSNGDFQAGSAASSSATTGTSTGVTSTGATSTSATPTPAAPTPSPGAPVSPTPLPAVKLGFVTQPTKAASVTNALTPITPAPQVAIENANGEVVTTANNAVTISLGVNPSGAVLSGTLTVNAVAGVATFSDLQISRAANGYTLIAMAEGLASGSTAQFTVHPLLLDYRTRHDFAAGPQPLIVTSADFNGDGLVDLATPNAPEGAHILLGRGDGTFEPPLEVAVNLTVALATGDFNDDGKPDLVAPDFYHDAVAIFLGNGDGTFQSPRNVATATALDDVVVADFNGDGRAGRGRSRPWDGCHHARQRRRHPAGSASSSPRRPAL